AEDGIRAVHVTGVQTCALPISFESAAVLCIDAVGECATTTIWHGQGTHLKQIAELRFPHSLGMLYSAFTYFCGFKVDSGEYKLRSEERRGGKDGSGGASPRHQK